jgi:hypothetical protein
MFLRLHNLEAFIKRQTIMDIEKSVPDKNPQWIIDLMNKAEER